jgi:hypothetical protein
MVVGTLVEGGQVPFSQLAPAVAETADADGAVAAADTPSRGGSSGGGAGAGSTSPSTVAARLEDSNIRVLIRHCIRAMKEHVNDTDLQQMGCYFLLVCAMHDPCVIGCLMLMLLRRL